MIRSISKWIVAGTSFLNIAIAFGINFSFSIFFVPILEEFKWSRASIAGAFSLSSLIIGVGSWPIGRLVDHFGPKRVLIGGSVVLSISTMASAWIQEIWQLYFLFGVLAAVGICSLGWVPNSALLSNWFVDNRGTMVGFAFSGIGAGMFILGPTTQYFISIFGWRLAYIVLGSASLVILVILNLMLQNSPGEASREYCLDESVIGNKCMAYSVEGWTLRSSMKNLSFWYLFFSIFLIPVGILPVIIYQVAYIIDHGYSNLTAVFVFGAVGLLSSAGRLFFGVLSDRIGREKAMTLSFFCSIVGIILLLFLPSLKSIFYLYIYAIFFGIGFGARGPIIASIVADRYQGKHFGSIYGFINIGSGIGGAIGPWLGGYFHDLTGSYRVSFFICIPILILACILFCTAGKSITKK